MCGANQVTTRFRCEEARHQNRERQRPIEARPDTPVAATAQVPSAWLRFQVQSHSKGPLSAFLREAPAPNWTDEQPEGKGKSDYVHEGRD